MTLLRTVPGLTGGSFRPTAVNFNGTTTELARGAELTGNADSKLHTCSLWFRTDSSASEALINFGGDANMHINFQTAGSAGKIETEWEAAGGTNVLQMLTTNAWDDGDWHHLYSYGDQDNNTNCRIYIDGVADATPSTRIGTAIDWTKGDCFIGAENGGDFFTGDMAELWFDNTQVLPAATYLTAFRSASGRPVSLNADGSKPTGSKPLIYLGGPFANWHTNKGSGGGFTINGTLTEATTNPAD